MKIKFMLLLAALACGCTGGRRDNLSGDTGQDPYVFLAGRLSRAHSGMANKKVAVLPFSYTDRRESDDGAVVSERLLTRVIQKGKLEVVERSLLEKVMGELKLQYSGVVDETSIRRLGKILGVEAVITGTLTRRAGGRLEVNSRLIRTETAVVLAAASAQVALDWESLPAVPPAAEAAAAAPAPLPAPPSAPPPGQEGDFPQAWKYRENLRVAEKSGSSLVDYQVLVKFDSSAPIKLGRMKPDCSDLRFANSDEKTGLNYWLEAGCGTGETRAWVRLPFLAKNSVKNIYMYYGNSFARRGSSGEATFEFFDDFEGNRIDPAKWRAMNYGSCSVEAVSGRAEFGTCSDGNTLNKPWLIPGSELGDKYVVGLDVYGRNFGGANPQWQTVVLRWDGQFASYPNNPRNALIVSALTSGSPRGAITAHRMDTAAPGGELLARMEEVFYPERWHRLEISDDSEEIRVAVDGAQQAAFRNSFRGGNAWAIYGRDYPKPSRGYVDNVRVRKYSPAEPEVYLHRPGGEDGAGRKFRVMR